MSSGPLAQAWRQQQRAIEKVKRARQMMPFLRHLVQEAAQMELEFNKEEVLLDLEALRDCLMAEVERDPELDEDQKIMLSNLVSGIAKNWSRMEGFVYDEQSKRFMCVAFVFVAGIDIMFRRYNVQVSGSSPEVQEVAGALGIEPPANGS